MPSWTRRRTLAALGTLPAASLAGCNDLVSASDDEAEEEYSLHLDSLDESLAERMLWSPEQFDGPTDDQQAEARRAAIEDGRYTTYGFPAISEDGEYTEYEGSYYRLSVVITGSKAIDRHVLRLRWLGRADDEDVPDPDAAIEDLPDPDRNAAGIAYFAARAREHGDGPDDLAEHGGFVYRRDLAADSVLVPDPEYETLSFHDHTVLRVEASEERLVEPAYSVVATELGDSMAEYADAVDAAKLDHRLSSADLSEAERELVVRARGDGYEEATPLSDAFDSLLRTLDLDDPADAISRGYLRYDGDDFRYELYVNEA